MGSFFQEHHDWLSNFAKEMEKDIEKVKQESKEFWEKQYALDEKDVKGGME